jgi:CRP/FNR family cyclic AMP-dependent transcriptional regulator
VRTPSPSVASYSTGSEPVVDRRLTQQNIADRVSASGKMVSRIMKDLVTGGYIGTEDGRIVILRQPPRAW